MPDTTPTPTRRTIHVDDLDPDFVRRVLGDGLTAIERFRQSVEKFVPPEKLDRLVSDLAADTERLVASGAMIEIVGPRGVLAWQPASDGPFAAAAPATVLKFRR
ncbi:hypothetical protein MKK69_22875 [Methylobacterium sp. J-026]|jgi:hypothetical protein|uniref:hypothetical protein n=1 Tax=unclassified Methylobacterium TaxID=2615210 RepID=UPI0011CAE77B|nr:MULTISPECIES: hypothetical protein [unclassified Methylobacterium]MCJ2136859.1 hypothetical protein [Methylobacterium sp. J-026]TXM71123.1 hypothetical protein FV229_00125 [Methylobacterium sp. WL120]